MSGDERVMAGQAVYTPAVLRLYDAWVLGISNRWIWKCPTPRLLKHFNRHVSGNHLDAGVGTGYFLDRCRFPQAEPRVALLDLNPHALRTASRRIARYRPEVYQANVLEPLPSDIPPFDSISLNYVLHCLPGTMETKGRAIEHLRARLEPGGVVFGSTLLGQGVSGGPMARWLQNRYNARGIFCNATDDLDGLRSVLRGEFDEVELEVVGCAALFSCR